MAEDWKKKKKKKGLGDLAENVQAEVEAERLRLVLLSTHLIRVRSLWVALEEVEVTHRLEGWSVGWFQVQQNGDREEERVESPKLKSRSC